MAPAPPPSHAATAVLEHIGRGADLIVPLANGEPVTLLDAIEAAAEHLDQVRVHQMHALHDRPYLHGAFGDRPAPRLLLPVPRHAALLPRRHDRPRAQQLQRDARRSSATARPTRSCWPPPRRPTATATSASGVNADYVASFIGRARFFLEANQQMPRTFGRNQVHVSQVVGWSEVGLPAGRGPARGADGQSTTASPPTSPSASPTAPRSRPASAPSRTPSSPALRGPPRPRHPHRAPLATASSTSSSAASSTASRKQLNRTKTVGTFALGTGALLRLPRREPGLRAVAGPLRERPAGDRPGAQLRVDQRDASPSTCSASAPPRRSAGTYYSSSGGQADFARGAMYSPGGQGFVVLHSTADGRHVSKIVPQLAPPATSSRRSRTRSTRSSPSGASPSCGAARSESGPRR